MEYQSAGSKIKKMRINAGLSQSELADSTQLSLRTIQRIENSETGPRGDSLKRISEALGVKVEELLAGDQTSNQTTNLSTTYSQSELQEDKWISLALRISPITYLINPLLAVLAPIIIWKLFENKLSGIKLDARKIIEVQLTWLIIMGLLYVYLFCAEFFNWWVPLRNIKWFISLPFLLFYLNSVFITIEVIGWIINKKRNTLSYQ
ncbi:helix-turn-helix domain-containing protein [Flavitalea sp.]|nr:helix-turn-helix domain-containing protein [Flavitalea sp.]